VQAGERGTFGCRDELGMLADTVAAPATTAPVTGSVPAAVVNGLALGYE
jgi:hypothetical protein